MEHSNINQLKIDFGYEKPLLSPLPIKKIHNAKRSKPYQLQEKGIETAKRFISNLAEKYFEINMLNGEAREFKMQKFKTELMENLLSTSIYKSILSPIYFKEFNDEILRINSLK